MKTENNPQYKYECNNCGFIKYGDGTLNCNRCNNCNSLKFGLFTKVWYNKPIPTENKE